MGSKNSKLYPDEELVLPSHGLLYGDKLPGGKISIRPMTTKEEKLLAGSAGSATATFNKLLERCITKPDINPMELLISDRFFIFIAIRWLTYGSKYSFKLVCPACKSKFTYELDIRSDLRIDNLDKGALEPFMITLPFSKVELGLRQLRGFDEESIENYTKSQLRNSTKSQEQGDVSYEFSIAKHIVSINGKDATMQDSLALVDGMHGGDSSSIKNMLDDNTSGVNPIFDVTCKSCFHEFEQKMPLTTEFFRSGH